MDPQESRNDEECSVTSSADGAAAVRLSKSDDEVSKKIGEQQEIEEYTTDGTDCTVIDKSAETLESATSNKKKRNKNRKRRSRRVVELVMTSDPETQPACREDEEEADVSLVAISKTELTTVKEEQDDKEPKNLVDNLEYSPTVAETLTLTETAGTGNGPLFASQEDFARSVVLGSTNYHPKTETEVDPLKVNAGPAKQKGLELEWDGNKDIAAIETSYYQHVGKEFTEVTEAAVLVQKDSKEEDVGSDENGNKPADSDHKASSSNDGLGVESSGSEILKKKKKRNRNKKSKSNGKPDENDKDSNVGSVDEGQQRLDNDRSNEAFGGENVSSNDADQEQTKAILPKPEITIHTLLGRAKDNAMFDSNSEIKAAPFLLTDDVMDNIAKHAAPEYNYHLKEQVDARARLHAIISKETQAKVEAATLSQCRQLTSENCNLESQLLMHRLQAAQRHKNTYGIKAPAAVSEEHIITRPEAENMGLMTEHETLDEIEVVQQEVLEEAVSKSGLKSQSEEAIKTEEAVLVATSIDKIEEVVQEEVLEEAVSKSGLKSHSEKVFKTAEAVLVAISSVTDESLGKIKIALIDKVDYEDPTPVLSCSGLKTEVVKVQVHAVSDHEEFSSCRENGEVQKLDDNLNNNQAVTEQTFETLRLELCSSSTDVKSKSVRDEKQLQDGDADATEMKGELDVSESKSVVHHASNQSVETLKYTEHSEEVIDKFNETATEATPSQLSEVSMDEFTAEERKASLSHDQSEETIHTVSEKIPLPSGIPFSYDDQRAMSKSGVCAASSTQDRRGPLRGEHGQATATSFDSAQREIYNGLSEENLNQSWCCVNFMRSRSKPKRETSAEVETPEEEPESRTRSRSLKERISKRLSLSKN